jgi:hypothetical protein
MTDDTTIDSPVKAKKPKKRKVRKAAPKPAAPKPASELAGLTVTDCCKACSADGCVISGQTYCAHPRKGGLQGVDMHNMAAIGRLNDARKLLARADAEKRFS